MGGGVIFECIILKGVPNKEASECMLLSHLPLLICPSHCCFYDGCRSGIFQYFKTFFLIKTCEIFANV